jgi:pSer/pThr/pTyr-binding forkhead associated (FHA) protein
VANEGEISQLPPVLGHLVVVDSGPSKITPGTSFNLNPQTTIGRGPTNTIQINESFVSAEHTRLWFRNGEWYVQDAGSRNGTFLNNQPARDALKARSGDIIQVGFLRFKLTQ